MAPQRVLEVKNGDPIQSVREFLRIPLESGRLNAFFLPVWSEGRKHPTPSVIVSPEELSDADPFAPVMFCNSAAAAFNEVVKAPSRRIGIVLRPCELRTFKFLISESGIQTMNYFLISMDCLATFPVEDFEWRLEKSAGRDHLSKTALHFAAQGGLLPSRYRGSCQLCDKPFPERADLQIELFGIETSKQITIKTARENAFEDLGLEKALLQEVPAEINERRKRTLNRLLEWRKQTHDYASSHLTPEQKTIDGLIGHLRGCSVCQTTVAEHCPVFEVGWVTGSEVVENEILENWLGYCGGCGMCKHECPEEFPLFKSISYLSRTIGTL